MTKGAFLILLILYSLSDSSQVAAQQLIIDSAWHHLRNAGEREWSEFPEQADARNLAIPFRMHKNAGEHTLSFRQYDVKLKWNVKLNGQPLGTLVEDEKDMISYLKIPPGALTENNVLEISSSDERPDDIRVGEISLHPLALDDLLSQARINISVSAEDFPDGIPCRITIVNSRGVLQTVSAQPADRLAVRPGYVYTASGSAQLGLPSGSYSLYATHGFEYNVDSAKIEVRVGEMRQQKMNLTREVSTPGWAGSDTHIHTFTWSKHGDATAAERVLTIAGEGIELPIITDHNVHADLKPFAESQRVVDHFTLVPGNEVTTPVGHFNLFPTQPADVVAHNARDWRSLAERFAGGNSAQAVILNHARDIHLNFRPFDPSLHLAAAGMRRDGWPFPANAMEVINSGSQQTDQLQLMRDWFGMLNGGQVITPVGSSDSHDVSRFIVGQARTFIRCNDETPGDIDVAEAVKNFIDGNVMVSFGLLAEIEINNAYGPGELVPASDEITVSIKVSGPSWSRAQRVVLYANGKEIRAEEIRDQGIGGLKWSGEWNLTLPSLDVFLVAMAEGPYHYLPYWPIAKPFQPVSPEWHPRVFGISGAVWLDADNNGKRNSARDYARRLVREAGSDMAGLVQNLASFNESVAVQAAALLHLKGKNLRGREITKALATASGETKTAFETVIRQLTTKTR